MRRFPGKLGAMVAHRTILASMACMVMLGGYASYRLMPTPNIYAGESGYPEERTVIGKEGTHPEKDFTMGFRCLVAYFTGRPSLWKWR